MLSSSRGANSGLHLHPLGHRLVSASCGASGTVDFWAVDRAAHLQSFEVDVELADVGAQPPPDALPPGTDGKLEGWPAHILPIVDTAMNALGGHIAIAAGRSARLFRFSADESQLIPVQNLRGHEQPVTRVALDSSGERALSADASGQIALWSISQGRTDHVLRISTLPTSVGFIWNNMLVMAGDATGRVICWEAEHGRRHLQFQAHHGALARTAFNNDSGVLLTVGGDNAARMWNLEEGKQIGRDIKHRSPICDAVFAYAGRFIVTAGSDGHVAVWNSTDGDLLDWYFDSAPVYRLSFDKLSGTVFAASGRSVKVLSVDWQRLRELDADARSHTAGQAPAGPDPAAMYAQPPSRPTGAVNPPRDGVAPVGTMMTARQTTDLPFPDRSNLAVPRGAVPGPARPGVGVGGPARHPTGAVGGVGGASLTRPAAPIAQRPPGGAMATQTLTTFNDAQKGSLADAVANVQRRAEEANQRATSYGIGKSQTVAAAANDANAFFSPVSPAVAPESQRMSRVEVDQLEPVSKGSPDPAGDLAILVSGARPAVQPESVELSSMAREARAAADARQAKLRRRLFVVGGSVLAAALATRFGVYYYYTEVGYPSDVQAEAESAQGQFDEVAGRVEGDFARYRADEDDAITGYRRSQSMTADSIERAVAQVQRRIDQRRAAADEQIGVAQRELDRRLDDLDEQRRVAASKLATVASVGGGVLALLASILLMGRQPAPAPAAAPVRRRR